MSIKQIIIDSSNDSSESTKEVIEPINISSTLLEEDYEELAWPDVEERERNKDISEDDWIDVPVPVVTEEEIQTFIESIMLDSLSSHI